MRLMILISRPPRQRLTLVTLVSTTSIALYRLTAISSCTKDLNLDSQGTEGPLSTLVSFSVMLSRGCFRVSIDL